MEVLNSQLGVALIIIALTGVVQLIVSNTHMKRMQKDIAEIKDDSKNFRENIYDRLGKVEITTAEIKGSMKHE